MRFRKCPKCNRQQETYVVICDCGYQFSDTDAIIGSSISDDPSTGSGGIVFGAVIGAIVGAISGYLFRPAIPVVGQQLPFEAVITRGASLRGLDQILVGLAQQSFNYLVFGSLICGVVGAVVGYFAKAARDATPASAPVNLNQANAAYQPQDSPQTVSRSAPVTVRLGDSREAVLAALGAPKKVMDLGPKALYVYPDLKITFVDGKVSDVE